MIDAMILGGNLSKFILSMYVVFDMGYSCGNMDQPLPCILDRGILIDSFDHSICLFLCCRGLYSEQPYIFILSGKINIYNDGS